MRNYKNRLRIGSHHDITLIVALAKSPQCAAAHDRELVYELVHGVPPLAACGDRDAPAPLDEGVRKQRHHRVRSPHVGCDVAHGGRGRV